MLLYIRRYTRNVMLQGHFQRDNKEQQDKLRFSELLVPEAQGTALPAWPWALMRSLSSPMLYNVFCSCSEEQVSTPAKSIQPVSQESVRLWGFSMIKG